MSDANTLHELQSLRQQLATLERVVYATPVHKAEPPKPQDYSGDIVTLQAQIGELKQAIESTRKSIPSTAGLVDLHSLRAAVEPLVAHIDSLHEEQKNLVTATAAQAAESAELAKAVAAATARSARDQLLNRVYTFAR